MQGIYLILSVIGLLVGLLFAWGTLGSLRMLILDIRRTKMEPGIEVINGNPWYLSGGEYSSGEALDDLRTNTSPEITLIYHEQGASVISSRQYRLVYIDRISRTLMMFLVFFMLASLCLKPSINFLFYQ